MLGPSKLLIPNGGSRRKGLGEEAEAEAGHQHTIRYCYMYMHIYILYVCMFVYTSE